MALVDCARGALLGNSTVSLFQKLFTRPAVGVGAEKHVLFRPSSVNQVFRECSIKTPDPCTHRESLTFTRVYYCVQQGGIVGNSSYDSRNLWSPTRATSLSKDQEPPGPPVCERNYQKYNGKARSHLGRAGDDMRAAKGQQREPSRLLSAPESTSSLF